MDRVETLSCSVSVKFVSTSCRVRVQFVQKALTELEHNGLIKVNPDNSITVIGVKSKHKKLTWTDSPYGEEKRPISDPVLTHKGGSKSKRKSKSKKKVKKKSAKKKIPEEVYREFDHLSISTAEVERLIADLGMTLEEINEYCDNIQNYSKNKKYKSLYLTIRSWRKREAIQASEEETAEEKEEERLLNLEWRSDIDIAADKVEREERKKEKK